MNDWRDGGLESCMMLTTCCVKGDAQGDECADVISMFGYSALEQGSEHLKRN